MWIVLFEIVRHSSFVHVFFEEGRFALLVQTAPVSTETKEIHGVSCRAVGIPGVLTNTTPGKKKSVVFKNVVYS